MTYTQFKETFKQKKMGYELQFNLGLKIDKIYFDHKSHNPNFTCIADLTTSISINNHTIVESGFNDILKYQNEKIIIDAGLTDELIEYTSTIEKDWNQSYELNKKISQEIFEYDPHPKDRRGYNKVYYFLRKDHIKKSLIEFFNKNIEIFKKETHIPLIKKCSEFNNLQVHTGEYDFEYPTYYNYFGPSKKIEFILSNHNTPDQIILEQALDLYDPLKINLDNLFPVIAIWDLGYLTGSEINALNDFYRYYLINAQINGIPSKSLEVFYDLPYGTLSIYNTLEKYNSIEYDTCWCFDTNNFADINKTIENINFKIHSNPWNPDDDMGERYDPEDETPENRLKSLKESFISNYAKLNYLYRNSASYSFTDRDSSAEVQINGTLLRAISTSPFSTSDDYSGNPLSYDTCFVIKTNSGKFAIIHAYIDLKKYEYNRHILVTYRTNNNLHDLISYLKSTPYLYSKLAKDLNIIRKVVID